MVERGTINNKHMTKTTKKETKKEPVKAKAVEPKKANKARDLPTAKCSACSGTGLERATFAQSPLCPVCAGSGVVEV